MMESLLVVILASLLGAVAVWVGSTTLRASRKVAGWSTTPGTVTDREVLQSQVGSTTTPGPRYTTRIAYTYVVAGQPYQGDKIIAFGTISGTREAMQQKLDGLGLSVEVRYDPANPADACLEAQPAWWAFGALAAGGFAFLVALVTLVGLLP